MVAPRIGLPTELNCFAKTANVSGLELTVILCVTRSVSVEATTPLARRRE